MANNSETKVTFKVFNGEFNKALKEMKSESSKLRQEFNLQQEQLKINGSETDKLSSKLNFLQKAHETATQKVKLTEAQLEKAKQLYGENSQEAETLSQQLVSAQISEQRFANQVAETTQALSRVESETSKAAISLNKLETEEKELVTASSKLRAEYELQKASLGSNASEADLLRVKISYLGKEHENAAQKIKNVDQQLQAAKMQYGEYSSEVSQLELKLTKLKTSEQNLANEIGKTNREIRTQAIESKKLQEKITTLGSNMREVGATVGPSFMAVGTAVGAGLAVAVNTAMDFEAQLSRVGAIAGATEEELKALRQSALDLGASTSKSATEIALGQEALAALGFTTNDIIGAMPGVISAAEASGSDMAQTAEVMASTLNIFGMEASKATKVADILAKTANISAADLTDMQYALKYAGPPASALGVSLEELSASIGIMTNAGMEGEQAGTTLRAALLNLLDPSEENSKLMKKMGVTVTDAKGNFVGLSSLIDNLSSSMKGQTDTQKAATLSALVGTEAVSGMLSLMAAGPTEIDKMTTSLERSGGASADAASKMKDNMKGSMDELTGAIETMSISIGTSLFPALTKIAQMVQSVADKFNSLSPSTQTFIGISIAVGAALMILTGIVGFLTMGLGAMAAAEWAVIAPIAGIIAAITAAIAIIIALAVIIYQNWDAIKAKTLEVFGLVWGAIKDGWSAVTNFFTVTVPQWINNMVIWFTEMKNKTVAKVLEFKQSATDLFQKFISFIMVIIKPFIDFFKRSFENMKLVVLGIIAVFIGLFTGNMETLRTGVMAIVQGFKRQFENVIILLKEGVINRIILLKDGAVKLFQNLKDGTVNKAKELYNGTISWFNSMKDKAISTFTSAKDNAISRMTAFKDGVTQKIRDVVNRFTELKEDIIVKVKGIDLKQIGKDIINGLVNGIRSKINSIKDAMKEAGDAVTGKIKSILKIKSPSRVLMQIGKWTGEGLAIGIEKMKKTLTTAATNMAQWITPEPSNLPDNEISFATKANQMAKNLAQTVSNNVSNVIQMYNTVRDDRDINLIAEEVDKILGGQV